MNKLTQYFSVLGFLLMYLPKIYSKRASVYDSLAGQNLNQYYCTKLLGCSHQNPVCGYESVELALKLFDNQCAMLKENCDNFFNYQEAKMEACKTRDDFLNKYGNSSVDWNHGHDGFNIPILNLTKPIVINMRGKRDFFKLVPGLIKAALSSSSDGGSATIKDITPIYPILHKLVKAGGND